MLRQMLLTRSVHLLNVTFLFFWLCHDIKIFLRQVTFDNLDTYPFDIQVTDLYEDITRSTQKKLLV